MRRRNLLIALALAGMSPAAFAQSRQPTIGILSPRPLGESAFAPGVVGRLAELGYRDGKTMKLLFRSADGYTNRYAGLSRELIDARCDVIITLGTEPATPLRDAGYPIPVVFLALDADPLERRLVKSLHKPGVNATGIYRPESALAGKRLELVRELGPTMRHVLVFSDATTKTQLPSLRDSAKRAGLKLTITEFGQPPFDYEAALAAVRSGGAHALLLLSSPMFSTDRVAIATLQQKYRLPSIGASIQQVEAGFAFSLHVNAVRMARRAAEIAALVLKGAKPAEIAVEQADEFELAINANAAKALGLKIPESVLARASRVVQ
jgi:putative ABC transport system substrate-binding protein